MEVTTVYTSPNPSKCEVLWKQLYFLASCVRKPWVMGGDFNAILKEDEKSGGSNRRIGSCAKFWSWVEDNNLVDLGFQGPQFTWAKGLIHERLDGFIGNQE